ncbi:MAG: hypothetical protein IPH07_25255 [Deltaproteobacteria bacterium]|nr:hypothetical protein [Deltaproteobacteria bacterium]MBP7288525.1 hypothetical protein [Nannocystaceae bacterium]
MTRSALFCALAPLLLACGSSPASDGSGSTATDGETEASSVSTPSGTSEDPDGTGPGSADATDATDTNDTGDTDDTGPSCEASHTSAEPGLWSLPQPTANVQYEPFTQLGGSTYCVGQDYADFNYTTIDLTGDGALDLVVTSACDDADVGTDLWLVYAGGVDGFADDAAVWSLPTPTANVQYEPFTQLGGSTYCVGQDSADFSYTTTDLTGDGIVDLVVTSACDAGDVGTDVWLVYAGGADGFADDAALWSLPTPTVSVQYEPFTQLGGNTYCVGQDSADFSYTTTDLTGDGIVDLVVTSACDAGDVGTNAWLVYAGGADGFADDAALWSLPTPTVNVQYEPFTQLGGNTYCVGQDSADFSYTTTDLTGDGIVDLVVTSACDAGDVGTDVWLVYAGGADGFADDAALWSLPMPTVSVQYEPFTQLGGNTYCVGQDSADFHYVTTDLNADGALDLVVTSACDAGDVGADLWLVYDGVAGGFADEPSVWMLPQPIVDVQYEPYTQLGGATYCVGQDSADFHYASVDLNGDRILDLVVTSACDPGDVGTEVWMLYPGACD